MFPKPRTLGAFFMALWCVAVVPAWGQDSIPSDIASATSALTAAQQQQVDRYVNRWVRQALEGDDQEVVRARDRLIEQLTRGGSRIFNTAYSTSLQNQLNQALQSDRAIVRLNMMLVVGRMITPEAVQLVRRGLEDNNPAVRYTAARAGSQLASREDNPLPRGDLHVLLTTLAAAMEDEQQQIVLEQVLLASAAIDLPEAVDALLTSLNRRVNLHARQPDLPLNADNETITRVYRRLALHEGQIDRELVVKMVQVAFRRLDLSVRLLQDNSLPGDRHAEHRRMVVDADRILRWAVSSQLARNANVPDRIEAAIQARQFGEVRLRVEEWRTLLQAQPISMSRDQLAVDMD